MVSETEGGPPMPFEAWAALQKERITRQTMEFLNEQGVPQDHAIRAKAARLIEEVASARFAKDLAEIEALSAGKH